MNKTVLIFGGTKESRMLAEEIAKKNFNVVINVTSEYAKEVIEKRDNIFVNVKKMEKEEIEHFIIRNHFDIVVDATHPYAEIITKNVKEVCSKLNVKYIRFLRKFSNIGYGKCFDSIEEVCNYLNNKKGNIFITTGSKDLSKFVNIDNYKYRLFVRVLPTIESIESCKKYDIPTKNIICMYPPYSLNLNIAMFDEVKANFVISKDTDRNGGFYNKMEAAKKVNAEFIVIKRPIEETGFDFVDIINEVIKYEKT